MMNKSATKATYFWYDVSEGVLSKVTALVIFLYVLVPDVYSLCLKITNFISI